ncbi:unnamed protein product [Dracunculus medinensis]|uniref:C-type lectin domain-containing protein n=1 Tax=Dracunculus medinensis TaxID=318479 RepID=A0A0N4UI84_DRAME|nr:unnamed protein product [Dracunculus medinensis]
MRWTFPLLFTSLIILTKSSALYQNVDTTLEKKCNYLKSKTTSSYVGNSCFVTTTEKYATTLENWHKLHEHCKALAGYSGRMAFIRTREQIDALLKDRVIEIFNEPETPYDAGEICKSEGGYLPSIHNDRQNQHIANMARHAKNIDYSKKRGNLEQWGPFLIGLKYENGKWSWQDGSETDYYRCASSGSSTVVHTPSIYKYVFLQTSTNANEGEAGFGYWSTNLKGTDKLPFICQKAPDIII